MKIEKQIIGVQFSGIGNETFYSYNPSTDENNDYLFYKSTSQEIRLAAEKEQLPEELTDLNPMKIYRLVNGVPY